MPEFTEADLDGFLDEALKPELMARLEIALRQDAELRQRLLAAQGRREAGLHSLGGVWRKHRVSCPSRQEIGAYLLGALAADRADYLRFHVETVGCRLCAANLADLDRRQQESAPEGDQRQRKFFQSSAGYLPSGEDAG